MKKKKTGESALDAAFGYLTPKPRTVRETEEYLDGLNYGEYEVCEAIERLKELNYLNDEKYAAEFVSTRLATKPISRKRLREQLVSHRLSGDVIDEALEQLTDEDERHNAKQVAEKFYRQFNGLEERERKQRVMSRLLSRGYCFEFIRQSIEEIMGEVEYPEGEYEDDAE